MNFFTFTLIFVLCQNQNVSCNFLKFLTNRFSDLAYTFTSTLDYLRLHVNNMFKVKDDTTRTIHFFNAQNLPIFSRKNISDISYNSSLKFAGRRPGKPKLIGELSDSQDIMEDMFVRPSTLQLVMAYGREVEAHTIHTSDGYVLTAHRILPNKNISSRYIKQTVILHHGLIGSSADWLLQGPLHCLPFILTDAGYDVWMSNARRNYYSRGHVQMKTTSPRFWKFSWQEMGEYDLAATIDYIRKIKGYKESNDKIDFIGYSMGCSALLVLLSTLPHYNQYLRVGILMAPLAYMSHSDGPLKSLMSISINPPEQLLKIIGSTEFLPSRLLPNWIAMKYCTGPMRFCCNPLFFISGGISSALSWDNKVVERIMAHVPAGTSTSTIMHYSQLIMNEKFHKFNDKNKEFPLNQVTLPIALISSDNDWLSTMPDVLRLYFSIPNPIDHYVIRGKNFSHIEFMWSPEVIELVYNKILEYLGNGLNLMTNEVINNGT